MYIGVQCSVGLAGGVGKSHTRSQARQRSAYSYRVGRPSGKRPCGVFGAMILRHHGHAIVLGWDCEVFAVVGHVAGWWLRQAFGHVQRLQSTRDCLCDDDMPGSIFRSPKSLPTACNVGFKEGESGAYGRQDKPPVL